MPVFDDYKDQLKSEIADFTNTGGRPGGAITAALFLKEFTGGLPWVHLDIAGTAWAERRSRISRKVRPASPFARWSSWRWTPRHGARRI
jgi:leucyl aminopeptidase